MSGRVGISFGGGILAVSVIAAGCGGGGPVAKPVDINTAPMVGNLVQGQVESSAGPLSGISAGVPATGSCSVISGDTSDTDADGIPANETVSWSGCTITSTSAGITEVINGTVTIQDTDPTHPTWSFGVGENVQVSVTGNGVSESASLTGSITGSQPGGAFQTKDKLALAASVSANGQSGSESENVDWTTLYSPSTAWQPGQMPVAGTYSVDGSFSFSVAEGGTLYGGSLTVTTSTPLTVDPTNCPGTLITAGTVVAAMPDRSVTVTWTGCGMTTVTYTGP